jgi:hypothetical protein
MKLLKTYTLPTDLYILGISNPTSSKDDILLMDDECPIDVVLQGEDKYHINTEGYINFVEGPNLPEFLKCIDGDLENYEYCDYIKLTDFVGTVHLNAKTESDGSYVHIEDIDMSEYIHYQGDESLEFYLGIEGTYTGVTESNCSQLN